MEAVFLFEASLSSRLPFTFWCTVESEMILVCVLIYTSFSVINLSPCLQVQLLGLLNALGFFTWHWLRCGAIPRPYPDRVCARLSRLLNQGCHQEALRGLNLPQVPSQAIFNGPSAHEQKCSRMQLCWSNLLRCWFLLGQTTQIEASDSQLPLILMSNQGLFRIYSFFSV